MNTPAVSIIVPIYNTEKFLHRTLDSILYQSEDDFELILVNDGSTDSSGNICNDYTLRDTRVKVIHQQNNGVSAARNAGLAIADGKYIMFVDSDDLLPTNSVKMLLKTIQISKHELVVGSCNIIGKNQRFNSLSAESNEYTKESICVEMMCVPKTGWLMSSVCGKLFLNDIIRKQNIRFNPDYVNGEDGLFLLDYLSKINHIININDCVYIIYRYEESERTSAVSALYYDFFKFHLIRSWKIWEIAKPRLLPNNESQFYIPFMDELITYLIRAMAYRDYFPKHDLFFQCRKLVKNLLVKNAIKVYKRSDPAYSKAIPVFIKLRCGILLYFAIRLRTSNYWKTHTRSKLVKSIYRGEESG